jgi:hypothetical protein
MQQFAPSYNRRALDFLVTHLCDSKELQHVVQFTGSANGVNMAQTAKNIGAYLETNGCTKREVRALRRIFKDLSDELRNLPLPVSIESARWAGLTPGQQELMGRVYRWLNGKDVKRLRCKNHK